MSFSSAVNLVLKKKNMKIYKKTKQQRYDLLLLGYTPEKIAEKVKASIPPGYKAKTLKICFSEDEALEWAGKKYPPEMSAEELHNLWYFNAKPEYKNPSMSGLYVEYKKRRAKRKPLIMYAEMSEDNKPHKFY